MSDKPLGGEPFWNINGKPLVEMPRDILARRIATAIYQSDINETCYKLADIFLHDIGEAGWVFWHSSLLVNERA